MDRRNRKYNWIWLLVFGVFFINGSLDSIFPLVILLIAVFIIAIAAVNSQKKSTSYRRTSYSHTSQRTSYRSYRPDNFTAADMARISVYLRRQFRNASYIDVNDIQLRLHEDTFSTLSSLDVYQDDSFLCSFNDFGRRNPKEYDEVLSVLKDRSEQPVQDGVFDVDAQAHQEPQDKPAETVKEESRAQEFIDEINSLNQDIPDEDISNGLYETSSLLNQIRELEEKLPNSKDSLQKLYAYYLPILIKILKQYVNLQSAVADENYTKTKKKLSDTIQLINEAMRNIISSMTDSDFMNISADMSTLETLLRKDGLTDEGQMKVKNDEQNG